MKHRKLFPSPDSTNGTDCSDFCFFYFQPPPPPSPVAVAVPDGADQSTHGVVSPTLIVVVTLLASFALLVGYYVVVAKSCFGLFNRRNNNNNNENENFSQSDGGDDEGLVDHENRAIDHHIWFITTVGLQQSIINSITVVKYKRNEGLIEGTECSVCLNEFREDETLRLLPKCSHAFHIPCIDKWLRSHTNCPLCRAHIVNDGNTNRRLESANRNGGDEIEDTQMGNSENGSTSQRVDQDVVNNIINSNRSCDLERENDNGEIVGSDDQVRPLGRSVSMDSSSSSSSSAAAAAVIAKEIGELESENIGRSNREVGEDQKECLRVSHVEMKRSLSCEGRFLSSSRPNQRLNSVHLPS